MQIGPGWGEVTEALQPRGENPYMTVLNNNQEFSVTQNEIRMIDKQIFPNTIDITDAFEVGYEIDIQDPIIFDKKKKKLVPVNEKEDTNNVTTSFLISSQFPFPLSAESYNPAYVTQPQKQFEFELISFMTNNKNIDFEKSVIDEFKEDDVDLSITETGTIKLTFPQEDDVILEEDEIENIPEDDEMIDDVPEEEDKEIITDNDIEVIPEDDDVEITSNDVTVINNDEVDYSKISGLVVLLSVMIAGFLIFKKFRESGFKNTLKQKPRQHQVKKAVIPFDDKLHIDIKSLKQ